MVGRVPNDGAPIDAPSAAELRERLSQRELEMDSLRAELAETNKGVVALYAELDDQASRLREAADLKSRFLSYMSHEFRTPLTSITSLSNLLLARMDGPLTSEQARQVEFVRGAALELTEMVNDLLDLAKVESGTIYGGCPARKIKDIPTELISGQIERIANHYLVYAGWFRDANAVPKE